MNDRKEEGFDRAMGEAKRQASRRLRPAKRPVHLKGQCGSLSRISPTPPLAIGVGIGWLLGRLHRPF